MEKWNTYYLEQLSAGAKEKLPEVLEKMGYKGRFKIAMDGHCLTIRSTFAVVSRAFQEAENLAHGERGHLIKIKQTSHATLWVPESEAKTLKEAYQKALQEVDNGWPVEDNPETAVGCSMDGYGYREEWELEYINH